jgi:hypothetical protein
MGYTPLLRSSDRAVRRPTEADLCGHLSFVAGQVDVTAPQRLEVTIGREVHPESGS